MTIWLLALLVLASLAGLGYRQGAIRVAFSFVGIVLGALLAVPLSGLARPVVGLGVKDPLALYLLSPVAVFIVISIVFKIIAANVHRKVDVFYKYRAGDLRCALWERMNRRVGLSLGLLNGVAYLVLLAFALFGVSYATVQLASEEGDPKSIRILNRLGKDLDRTSFSKVARALDGRQLWYQVADLAGLIYTNPLLEARLSRYPGLLGIGEMPQFQDLGRDMEFAQLRQRRAPLMETLQSPTLDVIHKNPELLRQIWEALKPDVSDLQKYLVSGISEKYAAERMLGRWNFDVNYAVILARKAKPNMPTSEMQKIRKWMAAAFAETTLVAMKDQRLLVKNLPINRIPQSPGAGNQTLEGQWSRSGQNYQVAFKDGPQAEASVDGDRIRFALDGTEMVFVRQH